MSTGGQQERRQPVDDDDFLTSIRTVRQMVEEEFGHTRRERKGRKSTNKANRILDKDNTGHDDVADNDDNRAAIFWKNQCLRLKQELFEERNESKDLVNRHKKNLVAISSKLKDALTEASQDRDLKEALVETLKAQTKHSEGLSQQLIESRKNSSTLQIIWKDLVQTMEDEKESMDREREASLRLLEETQERLASSLAEQERIKKESAERHKMLAKRVEELENVKKTNLPKEGSGNSKGSKESMRPEQVPPSYWNKSKIRNTLQQKLRELEQSLAKDSETIRSLEKQMKSTNPATKVMVKASKKTMIESASAISLAASLLATKKKQLRSKSLSVLEDVVVLQLQRLMEIHSEKALTRSDDSDDEWQSILQKLSKNRVKVLELRKDGLASDCDERDVHTESAEKKKRTGSSGDQVDEGSPTKKSKKEK